MTHPTADPATISAALGLAPDLTWKRGEHLVAPNGEVMPVIGRETTWSVHYDNPDRGPIEALIETVVRSLPAPNQRWSELLASGANASLILSIVGTRYQGAEIRAELVARLAEMSISIGIEVYAVPQNG